MNYDSLGYYAVLNADNESTPDFIKRSYYEKAKYWHPDHNTNPKAIEMFQKVSVAYEVLNNPKSRLEYDLLSIVYSQKEFPILGSLKIYKNQKDKDDNALRVLKQRKVLHGQVKETKDICNIREAGNMVLATSISNWLKGWWGKGGFKKTKAAIRYNLAATEAFDADNLKLLIHNAIAYAQEKNTEMAWVYAKQAEAMAAQNAFVVNKIAQYIDLLAYKPQKTVIIPYWNDKELRTRQYLFPFFLGFVALFVFLLMFVNQGFFSSTLSSDGYYEAVIIGNRIVPSDMVENHIVKLDTSDTDITALAHFKRDCTIYHGPDTRYSPLANVLKGQTVRITGHTYNKAWYKIVLDNGETGYVHKNNLIKGIGNPVPKGSKVYKGYNK